MIFSKSSCAAQPSFCSNNWEYITECYEIELDPDTKETAKALQKLGCNTSVPAVVIVGKLKGPTSKVMSLHLSGLLLQKLKAYQTMS